MKAEVSMTGIQRLLREPEMHDQMLQQAQLAADFARKIAPFRTGAYKTSIWARRGINGITTPRASASFGSNDRKAWLLEFGTRDTPAFHTLLRAAMWRGLKIKMVRRHGR